MDLEDAVKKTTRILDEEKAHPTVKYTIATTATADNAVSALVAFAPLLQHGKHPRTVSEKPERFALESTNLVLLCAIWDQLGEGERSKLLAHALARLSERFGERRGSTNSAGSSELPLVAEFAVRVGNKQEFVAALRTATLGPGLPQLLLQLEEMIALNYTTFTDEEYDGLSLAVEAIRNSADGTIRPARQTGTPAAFELARICEEARRLCGCVMEVCRKAQFFYTKGSLLPGLNLQINQDKDKVGTFLEKLGFTPLLIQSLNEAERLYRDTATPFELKSSQGHLRSFLEQLHVQACAKVHKQFGGSLPSKWGEALVYLLQRGVLTKPEEEFAAKFYTHYERHRGASPDCRA